MTERQTAAMLGSLLPPGWLSQRCSPSANGEKCQQSYPGVDPASYNTNLPAQ